jgi:hypothetical protein
MSVTRSGRCKVQVCVILKCCVEPLLIGTQKSALRHTLTILQGLETPTKVGEFREKSRSSRSYLPISAVLLLGQRRKCPTPYVTRNINRSITVWRDGAGVMFEFRKQGELGQALRDRFEIAIDRTIIGCFLLELLSLWTAAPQIQKLSLCQSTENDAETQDIQFEFEIPLKGLEAYPTG